MLNRECHISLLEMPVVQPSAPLVLSFLPHMQLQPGAMKPMPCSSPDLLSAGWGFEGSAVETWCSSLFGCPDCHRWRVSEVLSPRHSWCSPSTSGHPHQLTLLLWCYGVTTVLCREQPKYADLGVFLHTFNKDTDPQSASYLYSRPSLKNYNEFTDYQVWK